MNNNPPEKKSIHEIWETEEIRFLVLFSLVIQALLTFLSPLRKRYSQSHLQMFIWMLYLLADVVAVYTIGLISNNKGHHYAESLELLALWASFLLLHLGGPDTITALALEDNELWRRHALQLATQVSVTVIVFSRSFQYHKHNRLWIPTVLMFADGFIKYFERTCALFSASRDNFRDSIMRDAEAGPNYARLMEEYYSATSANIPAKFQEDDTKGKKDDEEQYYSEPNKGEKDYDEEQNSEQNEGKKGEEQNSAQNEGKKHSEQNSEPKGGGGGRGDTSMHYDRKRPYKPTLERKVRDAHYYYEMYKPLLAEGFLSLKDRQESRDFFLDKCDDDEIAFEIIQIELNLIYDAFYTKSFLMFTKRAVARVLCFVFVIVSLVLFCLKWDLKNQKTDAIVTFLLFCGAIALDISAATMFVLSDWWIILSEDKKREHSFRYKLMGSCFFRWSNSARRYCQSKRWSHTISQYNLLKFCFRRRCFLLRIPGIYKYKCVRDFIIKLIYVIPKKVVDDNSDIKNDSNDNEIHANLINFISKEIWDKARQASELQVAKDVFSSRGNLVLEDDYYLASECLRPWTEDLDFDESLMIWHLATDICYWMKTDYSSVPSAARIAKEKKHRDYSKELSDYMLYLVIWQQSLLSSVVGMSETRFQDTCEEARKFYKKEIFINWVEDLKICCGADRGPQVYQFQIEESKLFEEFSKQVLGVKVVIEPMVAKGDKSKSVLFDACRLALQLRMFGDHQWEITSKVWLELLCYAAVRCSPRYHIAQLSKGGELITLVWLYMAHLGLGERFLKNQGFGSTKLVIDK